ASRYAGGGWRSHRRARAPELISSAAGTPRERMAGRLRWTATGVRARTASTIVAVITATASTIASPGPTTSATRPQTASAAAARGVGLTAERPPTTAPS